MTTMLLYSPTGDKKQDEVLLEPYNYMVPKNENCIVMKISRALNHWLKIPEEKLKLIDDITLIFVNYYLVFDDIVDNSTVRRGIPATHMIYGVGNTLNSSCYGANIGWEKSFLLHPEAPKLVLEQLLLTHRAQGIEIIWRENFTSPTEEEYMEMAKKKISVIVMVLKLMELFSQDMRDFTPLITNLGVYLQIFDDYLNLFGKEYMDQYHYGGDITEGKFSFPITHAANKDPDDKRVIEILRKRTTNNDLKKYFISLLEEKGSREYTQKKLAAMRSEMVEEIKRFGGNPHIEEFLNPERKQMD